MELNLKWKPFCDVSSKNRLNYECILGWKKSVRFQMLYITDL